MNTRWHTFEPGVESEEEQRQQTLGLIDSWWQEFGNRTSDLEAQFRREIRWDLADWMREHLQAISPHLMWEFGPGLKGGHRLVITPEHRLELRPLVDELLRRAPTLEGWSFYGHRLPESLETALATIEPRTGAALAATSFKCQAGEFNLADITVEFPKTFVNQNENLAFSQAFVLIESLLGESVLNTWVGEINVGKKSSRSQGLELLPAALAEARDAVVQGLPELPICALPDEPMWTLLKTEPSAAEDYPAQKDIFVGKAMNAEQWENGHIGVPYYSERYSRAGEIFCYLKMDGSQGLEGEIFEDKGDLEDALDEALRSKDLGCFVSGGTGLRYSYVDLALTDLHEAIPVIREVLQGGRLTKRSWLLFYDSEWANEWVGIWADTPPPPMPPEGE